MALLSSVFSWFSRDHHSQQQMEILREKINTGNIKLLSLGFSGHFSKNNLKWKQSSCNGKFGERRYFPCYFLASKPTA